MLRRERLTAAGICIDCANKPKKKTSRRCYDCTNKLVSYNRANPKPKRERVKYMSADMADDCGGMTFTDIAKELGISRQRVMQIYFRAIDKVHLECRRSGIDASCIIGRGFSMISQCERWGAE